MKSYFVSKGWKFVKKDDLNNKEFTLLAISSGLSEEYSTLDSVIFEHTEVWQLFISERMYDDGYIDKKFSDICKVGLLDIGFEAEKKEKGYLVTITTIKLGDKQ